MCTQLLQVFAYALANEVADHKNKIVRRNARVRRIPTGKIVVILLQLTEFASSVLLVEWKSDLCFSDDAIAWVRIITRSGVT